MLIGGSRSTCLSSSQSPWWYRHPYMRWGTTSFLGNQLLCLSCPSRTDLSSWHSLRSVISYYFEKESDSQFPSCWRMYLCRNVPLYLFPTTYRHAQRAELDRDTHIAYHNTQLHFNYRILFWALYRVAGVEVQSLSLIARGGRRMRILKFEND